MISEGDFFLKHVWIDTNIIVYYVRNNKEFSPQVKQLVDEAKNGKLILKVSPLVISECVFVFMGPQFRLSKEQIKIALISFINLPGIDAEEKAVIEETMINFVRKGIDFVDAYLAAHAKAVSPPHVVTVNVGDFLKLGVKAEIPADFLAVRDDEKGSE